MPDDIAVLAQLDYQLTVLCSALLCENTATALTHCMNLDCPTVWRTVCADHLAKARDVDNTRRSKCRTCGTIAPRRDLLIARPL